MNHFVYINDCINKCNHGCNSSETSRAPFSATSLAPSCASLWRLLTAPSNVHVPSGSSLDYTVKWIINCSIKCIFFFTFLCIFKCCRNWNLRCAQVQYRMPPKVHLFIESFCAVLYLKKCTTMRIFKWNSVVTSSVPLISTLNAPSCPSLYKSQSTPLVVPSDKLSVASSIALTNAPLSAPWIARSNTSFLSLSCASSMAL